MLYYRVKIPDKHGCRMRLEWLEPVQVSKRRVYRTIRCKIREWERMERMKEQFREDIITLTKLFRIFRDSEQFDSYENELKAYKNYHDFLDKLTEKYHKTTRQITSAINY